MLLTLATSYEPATDLGFLLHKNPAKAQVFEQWFGSAHVFYPEATDQRCQVALFVEVDPINLTRGRSGRQGPDLTLGQYVNDRPYAASSLLAVALADVFRTAMRGQCRERPALAETPIPLEITIPAMPVGRSGDLPQRLFGPLGWQVDVEPIQLDPAFPDWGASRYASVLLRGTLRLADAINHLYVMLPVLDDAKHYWVASDEVDKLVRAGGGWLASHPERGFITRRYLVYRKGLTRQALARLADLDDAEAEALDPAVDEEAAPPGAAQDGDMDSEVEPDIDPPVPLAEARRGAVLAVLRSVGARRVLDLGCGSGALLQLLLDEPGFTEIVGTDVSARALDLAARRLRLDRMPDRKRDRITLLHSSLTYRDSRLAGYDAAVLMEVIEHVDADRLDALEQSVFGVAQPATVVVTTPNVEYNVRFEGLSAGTTRHHDHRFEWTRAEFAAWARPVAERYGYQVRFLLVGAEDAEVGAPTQMAVFHR